MKKKLPIGIQSFSDIRNKDYLYVDKTEHIYRMVSDGKVYILSRPRRFGKSLLVSTLDELFRGRKELFEGLYIYDKYDWTQKYPVIRLDFGKLSFNTPAELNQSLAAFVEIIADEYQIPLINAPYKVQFGYLIKKLRNSTGQQVVVLIDEYDKPIIDHLSNSETLEANKDILHDFYPVLKACDDDIRLIFLTGVSKFSGLSVFSALNNPDDITLNWEYVSICGYTQEELEYYFTDYLDELAASQNISRDELLNEIRTWYNGYSWDGKTTVYNPFSTLKFFKDREFNNYWFKTGTPTFLMELLKKRNQLKPVLEPFEVGSSVFDSYDPENITEIPLLFQTGYLTVKHKESSFEGVRYTLGIPNKEVKESFLEHLLHVYSNYPLGDIHELISRMRRQISAGDATALEQTLRMLLANIPSILHVEAEKHYHSLFLLMMQMLGFDIQGEKLTDIGRIDAVWKQSDLTVIAEIKFNLTKDIEDLLDDVMKQIYDEKYYEAYLDRKVMLMAIAFTGKEVKCKLKELTIK